MRLISCHGKMLQVRAALSPKDSCEAGLRGWDDLIPAGFASQSIHELLFDQAAGSTAPSLPALLLARGMMRLARSSLVHGDHSFDFRKLIWCDPDSTFYPPAVVAAGIPLDRLCVVRPAPSMVTWAVTECLRCAGMGVVVAELPAGLSRVEARRLQLAAERGGGFGLMLRRQTRGDRAGIYAAATRWLVSPAPGDRTTQRWTIQLIHGHGGRQGQSFLLEARRALASETAISADHTAADGIAANGIAANGIALNGIAAAHSLSPSAAVVHHAAGAAKSRASA